jgi:hypothetical protein
VIFDAGVNTAGESEFDPETLAHADI